MGPGSLGGFQRRLNQHSRSMPIRVAQSTPSGVVRRHGIPEEDRYGALARARIVIVAMARGALDGIPSSVPAQKHGSGALRWLKAAPSRGCSLSEVRPTLAEPEFGSRAAKPAPATCRTSPPAEAERGRPVMRVSLTQ